MTLDQAEAHFRANKTNKTAGEYLMRLMEYEFDDIIDDDTFFDGLAEIRDYLYWGTP